MKNIIETTYNKLIYTSFLYHTFVNTNFSSLTWRHQRTFDTELMTYVISRKVYNYNQTSYGDEFKLN